MRPEEALVRSSQDVRRNGKLPNSQNAIITAGSAPSKVERNRARYTAHDEPGEPGRGSLMVAEGDCVIIDSSSHYPASSCIPADELKVKE
jgi:hypothetical protein